MGSGALLCCMKEVEATDFTVPSIDSSATPVTLRILPKEPRTSLDAVPSTDWAVHLSSDWALSSDVWQAVSDACERIGYETHVGAKSVTVW